MNELKMNLARAMVAEAKAWETAKDTGFDISTPEGWAHACIRGAAQEAREAWAAQAPDAPTHSVSGCACADDDGNSRHYEIEDAAGKVFGGVNFDSESGCFFAYGTKDQCLELEVWLLKNYEWHHTCTQEQPVESVCAFGSWTNARRFIDDNGGA